MLNHRLYSFGQTVYINYIHVFNPLANFLRSNGISTENFIGFFSNGVNKALAMTHAKLAARIS